MAITIRPPELTTEAFLQTLERSRLIERSRLDVLLKSIPSQARICARTLADALVSDGHLTHYQADKLLKGLSQGLVLGPYHVLAPLGRGGMGTVYLARDTRSASPMVPAGREGGILGPVRTPASSLVALKILPPKRAREEENALARFLREQDLGQLLAHPNVTRTKEAGLIGGVHFLAMEYVPGESLQRLVAREGPRPVGEAARLFADVAAGLDHAHARGLIHRDLKPSNVMVTPEGRAKILDLGLALLMDEELPADRKVLGGEGYILGTMDYIAPEQGANATDVGPWSDLYALGCSLFFTVTGVPPFPGGSAQQKIRWHRNEIPPPVRSLNSTVPPEFAGLIEQLLEKRPDARPRSAKEVRERLQKWLSEPPVPIVTGELVSSEQEAVGAIDSPDYVPGLWETSNPIVIAELIEFDEEDEPQTKPSARPIPLRLKPPLRATVVAEPDDSPARILVWLWLLVPLSLVFLGLLFILLRGR